jgi:phosphoribosylformylglycinamidine synthase
MLLQRMQQVEAVAPPALSFRPKPLAGLGYNGGPVPTVLPDMIVLEGARALSPCRDRLQASMPSRRVADRRCLCYWIDPEPGTNPDREALKRILQAEEGFAPREPGATSRFVVPRLGTLSPWASKATELLRGAGLPVQRVERGTRIDVTGWPQDAATQAALAKLLHDPMTQSLLATREEGAALFTANARRLK